MQRPFVWLFRFKPPIGVEDDHTIAEAAVKVPVSLARLVKHHDSAIGHLSRGSPVEISARPGMETTKECRGVV